MTDRVLHLSTVAVLVLALGVGLAEAGDQFPGGGGGLPLSGGDLTGALTQTLSTDVVGYTMTLSSGHTADAFVIEDNANADLFAVDANGYVTTPRVYGRSGEALFLRAASSQDAYLQSSNGSGGGIHARQGGPVTVLGGYGLQHSGTVAANPAAPIACGSSWVGLVHYEDENDDSAAGHLCVCRGDADNGAGTVSGYSWVQVDDNATACFTNT